MAAETPGRQEGEAVYRDMAAKIMVDVARDLRQRQTNAEEVIWRVVRGRRLGGFKFRRQHPIAGTAFVADFLCYEAKLALEIDGPVHEGQQQEDRWRQAAIEEAGYRVLRFTNEQVLLSLSSTISEIHRALLASFPSPQGEGQG